MKTHSPKYITHRYGGEITTIMSWILVHRFGSFPMSLANNLILTVQFLLRFILS